MVCANIQIFISPLQLLRLEDQSHGSNDVPEGSRSLNEELALIGLAIHPPHPDDGQGNQDKREKNHGTHGNHTRDVSWRILKTASGISPKIQLEGEEKKCFGGGAARSYLLPEHQGRIDATDGRNTSHPCRINIPFCICPDVVHSPGVCRDQHRTASSLTQKGTSKTSWAR